MSIAEETWRSTMTRLNVVAQFYFGYYYFFTDKK